MDYEKIIYTDDDIIENKDDERVKDLIGKEVYSSWSRNVCLYRANHNCIDLQCFLIGIDPENSVAPFVVSPINYKSITNAITGPLTYNVSCLVGVKSANRYSSSGILSKECLGVEHVACKSVGDFLEAYRTSRKNTYVSRRGPEGVWVRKKHDNSLLHVLAIKNEGVATIDGMVDYETLLSDYTFSSGSPCGVLQKLP